MLRPSGDTALGEWGEPQDWRLVVHNDGHAPCRCNSDVAHQWAHGLLLHPPTAARDDRGRRLWNQDIEDEASWLAGVLLVPERAGLAVARSRLTLDDAAEVFGAARR